MTVPSWQFLVFVLAGAVVFSVTPTRWRQWVWLVMNLVFVWSLSGAIGPLIPLAGFLAIGYLGTRSAKMGRGPAILAIVLVLLVFVWLKRYSFIPDQLLLPSGAMLIGLSYIFFRVMHLVVDAGQGAERMDLVPYVNFTLNFPAFISGPIQRREDYEANGSLPLNTADIGFALWRMILGSFKVLVCSPILHAWQLALLASMTPGQVLIGAAIVALYPLFLYANFSGYTDFVIGAARLLRLRLPENFDSPFSSVNFIEFWNRWHISLSQWLRSYVFNPLLMGWMRRYRSARAKQYPAVMAFFITFFLVGAWHGQTSAFLFFGVLQGGGVAGNRLYQVAMTRRLSASGYERLGKNMLYRTIARGLTFTWFAFTLLWFWADWSKIHTFGEQLGGSGSVAAAVTIIAVASIVLAVPDLLARVVSTKAILTSRYSRTVFASTMILIMTIASLVSNMSAPEIVYKQF